MSLLTAGLGLYMDTDLAFFLNEHEGVRRSLLRKPVDSPHISSLMSPYVTLLISWEKKKGLFW